MEDILSTYTFLPWLRQGVAALIEEDENRGVPTASNRNTKRPSFVVKANISADDDAATIDSVERPIDLIGPGEIIGINRRAIVKTEPLDNITNFEPNYFPYIEFYEEDFPWRYSPAKAKNQKLRPWLTLVVLEENEFDRIKNVSQLLPVISVKDGPVEGAFPSHQDTWAWAHVHVNGNLKRTASDEVSQAVARLQSLVDRNPNIACSRLICPRKLKDNTKYYGFLLPAFERGRLAGLAATAEEIDSAFAQQSSWGQAHELYPGQWPVYFEWSFKTGGLGDFEYLVRQIVPRPVHPEVGKRPMDIQRPGYLLSYSGGTGPSQGTLALEGALKIPKSKSEPFLKSSEPEKLKFVLRLTELLNLNEDLKSTLPATNPYGKNPFYPNDAQNIQDDPIITPPLYGQWHALRNRVVASGREQNRWFNQLNLDPRHRTVAGFGTNVIKKNQESYMKRAWEQLGEVREANKKLRLAQLAAEASRKIYDKNIATQPVGQLTATMAKLQPKLLFEDKTVYGHIDQSRLPNAVRETTYLKISRPEGALMQRAGGTEAVLSVQADLVGELAQGRLSVSPKVELNDAVMKLDNAQVNQAVNSVAEQRSRQSVQIDTGAGTTQAVAISEVKEAVVPLTDYYQPRNWVSDTAAPTVNINRLNDYMLEQLRPEKTIRDKVLQGILLGAAIPKPEKIVPIMAHPKFTEPLYNELVDISEELLLPNISLIPQDTMSLLQTNQAFIESYMVGLNHEMARELLWREYMTDQRGSYFRQFWDTSDMVPTDSADVNPLMERRYDIEEIHKWTNKALGRNLPAKLQDSGEKVVLVLRGELLKKYPNTLIYMQKAKWQKATSGGPDKKKPRNLDDEIISPVFGAQVKPDIYFLGFDLSIEEARGDETVNNKPGWFFIIQERPGEIRFGLDYSESPNPSRASEWNDFTWNHLDDNIAFLPVTIPSGIGPSSSKTSWGENAAHMASILYQNPFMMAVHAKEMLPR